MPDTEQRRYGVMEDLPVVWTPNVEAFEYQTTKWVPIDPIEPFTKARILSASEFKDLFSDVPAPPPPGDFPEDFKPAGAPAATTSTSA